MIKHIVYVCLAVLLLTGCRAADNGEKMCDTVVDDYGETVVVPHNPHRIVSASPAVTEIMFAIGTDSLLVGRTDFCNYPPEAEQIESIGGISNLNVEKIVSLCPDLVISGSMVPQKNIRKLASLGVPVVCVIEKQHFDGLFDNIVRIGELTRHEVEADSLNALIRQRLAMIEEGGEACATTADNSNPHRPTVYYVVGFGSTGNFTAGGDSFIDDIITMAGGTNIAHDLTGWSYSLEALMGGDPDYVVIRREDSAAFCQMHPYNRLTAVRQRRVIGINSGLIDLQTPRNIEAVMFLHSKIKNVQ